MFFNRTFHPDEANQAFTTGKLLETNTYKYDPADHHGPVLYYAATPIQKFVGATSTSDMDGNALRATPFIFAVITLLLGFLAITKTVKKFGFIPALFFVITLATAPIFAFFSSFFIQEILFGAFIFLMIFSAVCYANSMRGTDPIKVYPNKQAGRFSMLFGIGAGFAFATKETSCIAFLAFAISGIIVLRPQGIAKHWNTTHFLLALFSGLLTAILFFSSFGTHFQGVYDAFIAMPANYFNRAAGDASSDGAAAHVHEWWWYLKLLFVPEFANKSLTIPNLSTFPWPLPLQRALSSGWRFTELPILILALIPLFIPCTTKQPSGDRPLSIIIKWHKFFTLFTIIQLIVYSAIPYKTPWCMLTIVEGLSLSAALALYILFLRFSFKRGQTLLTQGTDPINSGDRPHQILIPIIGVMLALSGIWMHARGIRYMMKVPDAAAIPYNYANASYDVKNLAKVVLDEMKNANGNEYVAVVLPRDCVWPLPWYLRKISKQTGYWTNFSDLKSISSMSKPKIIVVSMDETDTAAKMFPEKKQGGIFAIRPGVLVTIFSDSEK